MVYRVFSALILLTIVGASNAKTQVHQGLEYTCNGESVDCIFNIGADMTSATGVPEGATKSSLREFKRIAQTHLMISNNTDSTIAIWTQQSFAPATIIARIPAQKTAELIVPSYMSRIFAIRDGLMAQAAVATKNGGLAFEQALTNLDPQRINWLVENREPYRDYAQTHANSQLLKQITKDGARYINTITAHIQQHDNGALQYISTLESVQQLK